MATGQTSPAESTFKNQIYFTKVPDQGKCEVLLKNFVFFTAYWQLLRIALKNSVFPEKAWRL